MVNYLNLVSLFTAMAPILVSEEKLNKVLLDVETLIVDVSSLLDQDELTKKRLADIKANPSIGISEQELNQYLAKRGVTIE
jgi:hypothetical protein